MNKAKQLRFKFPKKDNILTKSIKVSQKSMLSMALLAVFSTSIVNSPLDLMAASPGADDGLADSTLRIVFQLDQAKEQARLPEAGDVEPVRSRSVHTMTAYNSEEAQCDASPCITANGFNVCEHGIEDTVAANFLPFGTRIRIPDLFGERIFIVRDRMNKRYSNRVDIWMLDKQEARKFGVRVARIEVLD